MTHPDAETIKILTQGLEDVVNPLDRLQRLAEAEGNILSGMAYSIANDKSYIQSIAHDALRAALYATDGHTDPRETWESIAQWCEDTFGPVTLERTAERANEEMTELLANPDDVMEAADVLIVLSRYPGIWEAVERKMAINRARVWDVRGDGTGYHVPQATPS